MINPGIVASDEYLILTLRYMASGEETRRERIARQAEESQKLLALGYKLDYRFKPTEREVAVAIKERIENETGVSLELIEGFDLAL